MPLSRKLSGVSSSTAYKYFLICSNCIFLKVSEEKVHARIWHWKKIWNFKTNLWKTAKLPCFWNSPIYISILYCTFYSLHQALWKVSIFKSNDFSVILLLLSDWSVIFFFRFFQIKMILYGGSLFRLRISISWCQFTFDHGGVLTWSPLSSQPHHKIGRIKGFRWVGKSKKKKISFHCSSTCGSNFAEIFSSEVRLCTVIFANISAKTK